MKSIVILIVVLAGFSPTLQAATDDFDDIVEFVVKPLTRPIIEQMRSGGYVLYMRHGKSDTTHPDHINVDIADCATQRPLTDEGRRIMAKVGKEIRRLKIPVGEVFASPMCRTKETASIVFGKNATLLNHLRFTANMTDRERLDGLETIRELVSKPVPSKVNRVIVAHSQNLMQLISYLPTPEGTVAIFQPLGDKQFKYIASVRPEQWETIQP